MNLAAKKLSEDRSSTSSDKAIELKGVDIVTPRGQVSAHRLSRPSPISWAIPMHKAVPAGAAAIRVVPTAEQWVPMALY